MKPDSILIGIFIFGLGMFAGYVAFGKKNEAIEEKEPEAFNLAGNFRLPCLTDKCRARRIAQELGYTNIPELGLK